MKDFRTRFLQAWPLTVKAMLCVMAFLAGLYLRDLTAGKETEYIKENRTARTQSHELYMTVNEPETQKETVNVRTDPFDFAGIWNSAVDAGTSMLEKLTDTVTKSEFGQTVLDEKDRQDLENLRDLTTELIGLLKTEDDMQE
jgi:hypothetical protein